MLAFAAIVLFAKAQANDRAEPVEVPSQPSEDGAIALALQRNFGIQHQARNDVNENFHDASVLGLQRGWSVKKGVIVTEEATVAGDAPVSYSVLGLQRSFSVKRSADVAEASGVGESFSDASVLGLQRSWSVKKGVIDDKEVADVGEAFPVTSILGFQRGYAVKNGATVAEDSSPTVDGTAGSEFLRRGFNPAEGAPPAEGANSPSASVLGLQLSVSMRKTGSVVESDFV